MKIGKKMRNIIIGIVYLVLFYMVIFFVAPVEYMDIEEKIWDCLTATISINLIILLFLSPYLIGIHKAHKSIRKEKLSEDDLKNNKDYYRDILYNYSPAVLSYVDDMQFDYKRVIVSTLLYLKQNEYIEIKDNIIEKTNKTINNNEIGDTEKLVLNSIQNGKVTVNELGLENAVISDSINKKVIEKNNNILKKILIKVAKVIAIFSVLYFLDIVLYETIIGELIDYIIIPAYSTIGFVYILVYGIKYYKSPIFRTMNGVDINRKIEGLKNYIKDYSLLDTREAKELEVWGEYLIYSVIFDQNIKIVDEYSKFIN